MYVRFEWFINNYLIHTYTRQCVHKFFFVCLDTGLWNLRVSSEPSLPIEFLQIIIFIPIIICSSRCRPAPQLVILCTSSSFVSFFVILVYFSVFGLRQLRKKLMRQNLTTVKHTCAVFPKDQQSESLRWRK